MLPTQAEVKARFSYDPSTGVFVDVATGKVAGSPDGNGYLRVSVAGSKILLHRLAFLWMQGDWPRSAVDHVNGVVTDNRWENLRQATAAQNAQNRRAVAKSEATQGKKGVSVGADGRYRVSITVDGIRHKIPGSFDTASDAHKAYVEASQKMFGQFERAVGAATLSVPDRGSDIEKDSTLNALLKRKAAVIQQLADIDAAIAALQAAPRRGVKDTNAYQEMRAKEKRDEKNARINQRLFQLSKKSAIHPLQK